MQYIWPLIMGTSILGCNQVTNFEEGGGGVREILGSKIVVEEDELLLNAQNTLQKARKKETLGGTPTQH